MNESLIVKIQDENARKVIYHQDMEIKALKLEIEKLKQAHAQPINAIGFRQNTVTETLDTTFPKRVFKGGD